MIRPILGIFAVATGTIFLVGCDETERASGDGILRALGVTTSVPEPSTASFVEVVEEVVEPGPCSVPASMFRSHWCNPDTGKFEPIP